jgi:hypothetical protein
MIVVRRGEAGVESTRSERAFEDGRMELFLDVDTLSSRPDLNRSNDEGIPRRACRAGASSSQRGSDLTS